jgi:hypothetical protein
MRRLTPIHSVLMLLVCAMLLSSSAKSQPTFTAGFGTVGVNPAIGLEFDYNVYSFGGDSTLQSMRLGSGIAILSPKGSYFVPVEGRLVWFRGSSHLETMMGLALQIYWEPAERFERSVGDKFLGRSLISPSFSCTYRFEPEDGGFFFRVGLGGFYNFGDKKVWYMVVASYGISFN